MFTDKITTKQRIGERHPILQVVGKAVVGAMVFTFIALSLALVFTNLSVKKVEAQQVFNPVHLSDFYKTH